MRYLVDAYNLLFRIDPGLGELQPLREKLIEDLDQKASLLNLDVWLIFDAPSQYGAATRLKHNHLEIVFTGEGITADEHIIDALAHHPNPKQVTVVTSDKRLAWEARNHGGKTESVESFLSRLRKRLRKKPVHRQPPKERLPPTPELPSPKTEVDYDYLTTFEKRHKDLFQNNGRLKPPLDQPEISEYHRWLEIFQKKLENPND